MPAEVHFEVLGVKFDLRLNNLMGYKPGEIGGKTFLSGKNSLRNFGADFRTDLGANFRNFVSNFVSLFVGDSSGAQHR